jgi:hypothetical protein
VFASSTSICTEARSLVAWGASFTLFHMSTFADASPGVASSSSLGPLRSPAPKTLSSPLQAYQTYQNDDLINTNTFWPRSLARRPCRETGRVMRRLGDLGMLAKRLLVIPEPWFGNTWWLFRGRSSSVLFFSHCAGCPSRIDPKIMKLFVPCSTRCSLRSCNRSSRPSHSATHRTQGSCLRPPRSEGSRPSRYAPPAP